MKKDYDIIYADPPWKYEANTSPPNRVIENHYSTMEPEEIKRMEIPAKKDSLCYLWATSPKLYEALNVMEAWGFEYRTSLVWDKGRGGSMGYWFRIQHELLLLGRKGKFKTPDPENRIYSIFRKRKDRHSEKPIQIMELIDLWYPKAKKLEMFSRSKHPGWDMHGNDKKLNEVNEYQSYLIKREIKDYQTNKC